MFRTDKSLSGGPLFIRPSLAHGILQGFPADTGPSDGDFEEAYVTARFRVRFSEQEFRKLVEIVRDHKKRYTM